MEILLVAFAILFAIFLIVLFTGFSSILNGWVLTKLWLWFAVPFFGFKPLTIAYAIGISLIFNLLTKDYSSVDNAKKENNTKTELFMISLTPFITPLVVLLMGYIVHLFI